MLKYKDMFWTIFSKLVIDRWFFFSIIKSSTTISPLFSCLPPGMFNKAVINDMMSDMMTTFSDLFPISDTDLLSSRRFESRKIVFHIESNIF